MTMKQVLEWIGKVGTPAESADLFAEIADPSTTIENVIAIGGPEVNGKVPRCTTVSIEQMTLPKRKARFPTKTRFLVIHETGDDMPKEAADRELRTLVTTHEMASVGEIIAWVEETCFVGDNDDLFQMVVKYSVAAEGVVSVFLEVCGNISQGATGHIAPFTAEGPYPPGMKIVVAFVKDEVNVVETADADDTDADGTGDADDDNTGDGGATDTSE